LKVKDFTYVKDLGITVVHSYIMLYDYLGLSEDMPWRDDMPEELPRELLDDLQEGFDALRSAGLKTVLCPAYAWTWTPPVAHNWDIIEKHLSQLYACISKNADVVMGLEAGVLGRWGEWHTDGIYTASDSKQGAAFRYKLAKHILDSTPDTIPLRIRYPAAIKEILYLGENPLEGQEPLTKSQLDRIGYVDNSIMVDINDWGSYDPRNVWYGKAIGLYSVAVTNEQLREWVYGLRTSFGANVLVGGEMEWNGDVTVDHELSEPPARVLSEIMLLHTTDMNMDYNTAHLDFWKETNVQSSDIGEPAESVYERMRRRLGYRLRLTEAEMTTSEAAGGEFKISAEIINDGAAGIVNARPLFVVLDNGGKSRYDILIEDADVRLWLSGQNTFEASFTLPRDMPKGTYIVALWMPDKFERLRDRPEYSVRLANRGVWNAEKGYNKIGELVIFE
jgi:hypothetical protein